ncbi:MAG: DUF2259 domain-containing protein [Spirochaetaceae bacterium]|jgi:predicted secreted protein|nr:DUF2259 domain-containing protein [Spirochaetaceae bacterium]
MFIQKSRRLCIFAFVCCAINVYAGDVASFTDLGFSENGKYYAFAQYGVEESTLLPWAELYIVDVAANDFVKGGKLSYKHIKEIEAGQDGSGALYRLLTEHTALAGSYGINFLRQGIPLFISLENGQKADGDSVEYRDFENDAAYTARLKPVIRGTAGSLTSSFIISLERCVGSSTANYTVGTPEIRRALVTTYTIKRVLISPDRKSMVFVIEMTKTKNENEAPNIRYMVETVRF